MTASPPDLQRLFETGSSWGDDRLLQVDRSKRTAWRIAGLMGVIAILEAIALSALVPLRTVVPMAVLVDRQTGYATTVDPAKSTNIAPDAALTRSHLAQYVMARETVDRSSVAADYRKVVLWSADAARRTYLNAMKPDNPLNPYARVPRGTTVRTMVRSVSPLEAGRALVRFDVMIGSDDGQSSRQPFVAVIGYRYRERILSEADRFINPLGFEVTSYRRNAETPAEPGQLTGVAARAYEPDRNFGHADLVVNTP
ncbi:MAG TPA: VirB8/TrbF family protein [Xanthobacteraceae bacterium]|jgi:type IV secretion system protein VirB8|nr:VirB8/TrbF family protein [Xanthobacteraceae bacterium]